MSQPSSNPFTVPLPFQHFNGDYRDAYVISSELNKTVNQCYSDCKNDRNCEFFKFKRSGNNCQLFAADGIQQSGIRIVPNLRGVSTSHIYSSTISETNPIRSPIPSVSDLLSCERICNSDLNCNVYTYDPNSLTCTLYGTPVEFGNVGSAKDTVINFFTESVSINSITQNLRLINLTGSVSKLRLYDPIEVSLNGTLYTGFTVSQFVSKEGISFVPSIPLETGSYNITLSSPNSISELSFNYTKPSITLSTPVYNIGETTLNILGTLNLIGTSASSLQVVYGDSNTVLTEITQNNFLNGIYVPITSLPYGRYEIKVRLKDDPTIISNSINLNYIESYVTQTPRPFPDTVSTIIKHVGSNKYLYWNGVQTSPAISNFSLIDYWSGGLSHASIARGTQFKMIDMTSTSDASPSPTPKLLDWYQWRVVKDVRTTSTTLNNTVNVAVNFSNVFFIGAGTAGQSNGYGVQTLAQTTEHPSFNEGWAIINFESSNNAIVYYRQGVTGSSGIGEIPKAVGYLTADSRGTVSFITMHDQIPLNTSSNSWSLYKCSSTSGQYCNTVSFADTMDFKGFPTLVHAGTSSQTSIKFAVSTTGVVDPIGTSTNIAIRISEGTNMSGNIINVNSFPAKFTSASSLSSAIYTLSNPLRFGNYYTIEFSSPDLNVVDSPRLNTFMRSTVSTVAGSSAKINTNPSGDGAPSVATFYYPFQVIFNSFDSNVYVLEGNNTSPCIRQINTKNGSNSVTTIAGDRINRDSVTSFYYPGGMTFNPSDNMIYVIELAAPCNLRRVDPVSRTISKLTTNWANVNDRNTGTGGLMKIIKHGGDFYIMSNFHEILKVPDPGPGATSTGTFTSVAGLHNSAGYIDGFGSNARFNFLDLKTDMVSDPNSNYIYISEVSNNRIRRLNTLDNSVTTIATVTSPCGITFNTSDNMLYVTTSGHFIMRVNPGTGEVVKIAGGGTGTAYDSINGLSSRFFGPYSIVYNPVNTNLYVSDNLNGMIRMIS